MSTVQVINAILHISCYILERTPMKDCINGSIRHLHITKSHNTRRNTIASRYLKFRLTMRPHAHNMRTVFQIIDFEHFTQLSGNSKYSISGIVIYKTTPCLRQSRTGTLQSIFIGSRNSAKLIHQFSISAYFAKATITRIIGNDKGRVLTHHKIECPKNISIQTHRFLTKQ